MRTARLPVIALLLLAPVCAEFLWGYDDSTGDPAALLAMLFFVPLYGAPAVLVREIARRLGLGWAGILLLAAAFGVVQAGLVDQSMFSRSYRDIPWWSAASEPTFIEPLRVSVYLVVTFVTGHVVQSIGRPIALVETLFTGRRAAAVPWVGRPSDAGRPLTYVRPRWPRRRPRLRRQLSGTRPPAVAARRRPAHLPGRVPAPWVVACRSRPGPASPRSPPRSRCRGRRDRRPRRRGRLVGTVARVVAPAPRRRPGRAPSWARPWSPSPRRARTATRVRRNGGAPAGGRASVAGQRVADAAPWPAGST